MRERIDRFRSLETLELVRPEARQCRLWRERIDDEICSCPGAEHLAAIGESAYARGAIDSGAVVVTIATFSLPGVQSRADRQLQISCPPVGGEGALHRKRRGRGVGRPSEHGERGVA